MRIYFFTVVFFILGIYNTFSQTSSVLVSFDTTKALIGDRVNLNVVVKVVNEDKVEFPKIEDSIPKQIEIIKQTKIDSLIKDNFTLYKKTFEITSFDSGNFIVPEIPFKIKKKSSEYTLYSYSTNITYTPVEINEKGDIFDIKSIIGLKGSFPWLWLFLGIILLVLIAIIIRYFYNKNKKAKDMIEEYSLTALEEILLFINKIKQKKEWENENNLKNFYSDISEAVRKFLERKYKFNALEITTNEIIEHLKNNKVLENEKINTLNNILTFSDLVKFAKLKPKKDKNIETFESLESLFIDIKKEEDLKEKNTTT